MNLSTILNYIMWAIIIITVIGGVLIRIKIGNIKSSSPRNKWTIKRNSMLTLAVIVFFLSYWINIIMNENLVREGITGWKVYVLVVGLILGICSVILLIYGQFFRNNDS